MSVWETCPETIAINFCKSLLRAENTQFYQDTLSFHLRKKSLQTVSIKIKQSLKQKEKLEKKVPVSVIILSGITSAPKRTLCSDIDYLCLPICPQETQSPQQR